MVSFSKLLVAMELLTFSLTKNLAAKMTKELQDYSLNNLTFYGLEIVDLTQKYPDLDTTQEIRIENRNQITYGFLKEMAKDGNKIRVFLENDGTYVVPNYLKNGQSESFEVQEWDFNNANIVGDEVSTILLSPELIHDNKDGSGSVGSSVTLEVSAKMKFSEKTSLTLDPKVSLVSVTLIPGAYIGFTVETAKTNTRSFKYATSITISSSCSSVGGHTVGQYLSVGFNRIENIKVTTYVYTPNVGWIENSIDYLSSYVNPSPSVVCVAV